MANHTFFFVRLTDDNLVPQGKNREGLLFAKTTLVLFVKRLNGCARVGEPKSSTLVDRRKIWIVFELTRTTVTGKLQLF